MTDLDRSLTFWSSGVYSLIWLLTDKFYYNQLIVEVVAVTAQYKGWKLKWLRPKSVWSAYKPFFWGLRRGEAHWHDRNIWCNGSCCIFHS